MRTDIPKMFCLLTACYMQHVKETKNKQKCVYDYVCWCGWYGLHVYKILSMLQTSMCMKYCPPLKHRLYSLTPPHTHTHTHTHIHSYTQPHTHIHSYTPTHTHTHIQSLTHTLTQTYTHTHTHIHPHSYLNGRM